MPIIAKIRYIASRPWAVGIIFGGDRRLADRLILGLKDDGPLVVGVNDPYSPEDRVFYTHEWHAEPLNLPSAMIEIRNDLIEYPASRRSRPKMMPMAHGRVTPCNTGVIAVITFLTAI